MKTIVVVTLMLLPIIAPGQPLDELRNDVLRMLKSTRGTFAVVFKPLDNGTGIMINEKVMFHAASTMKTPVMIEVFRQAREGRFSLDDSVLIQNEFKSIVDSSEYRLDLADDSDDSMYKRLGSKASVRELLQAMITVSSNLATNLLMQLVRADSVTTTMRQLGAHDIEVLRGVEDQKAFEKGMNNRTNAYDLAVVLSAIAEGKAVDRAASAEMMNILFAQHFRDIIPAQLPSDVKVAHKTGSITGVEHDSGIVCLPDRGQYVLVLLSSGLHDAAEGKKTLAAVSRRIYDFMMQAR